VVLGTHAISRAVLDCAAVLLMAGLAGCAGTPEEQPKTAYYRCADTSRFGVTPLKNDKIELSRSPNRYTLKRVEAASGSKYASSKASFWNQGEDALIAVGDKRYSGCKLDSVQSDPASISTLQRFLMQGGTGGSGGQR
jgi:membrane-bound inhibitor of C-type lysozyme